MAPFQLDVDLSARLRGLAPGTLLGPPLRRFLSRSTAEIRDTAAARAPADLGRLRRTHVAEVAPGQLPRWGEVRVDSQVAIYVHNGTRPHWAPVGALRGWAERHGMNPFALQRSIARKGTRPNPWFEATVREDAPRIVDSAARAMRAAIVRQWGP